MRLFAVLALVLPLAACGGGGASSSGGGGTELEVTVWPAGRDGPSTSHKITCPGDERCDRLARAPGAGRSRPCRRGSAAPRSTAGPTWRRCTARSTGAGSTRPSSAPTAARPTAGTRLQLPASRSRRDRGAAARGGAEVDLVSAQLPLHRLGAPRQVSTCVAWEDGAPVGHAHVAWDARAARAPGRLRAGAAAAARHRRRALAGVRGAGPRARPQARRPRGRGGQRRRDRALRAARLRPHRRPAAPRRRHRAAAHGRRSRSTTRCCATRSRSRPSSIAARERRSSSSARGRHQRRGARCA